jgi:hypothetical protein
MSPSRVAFEAPGGVLETTYGDDAVISSLLGSTTFPLATVFAGVDQLEA